MKKQSSSEDGRDSRDSRDSRAAITTPTIRLEICHGEAIFQSGLFGYGIDDGAGVIAQPYFALQFADGLSKYNQNDEKQYHIDLQTALRAFEILMDHFIGDSQKPQPTRLAGALNRLPCSEPSKITRLCSPRINSIVHYVDLFLELFFSPVFVLWDILGLTASSIAHSFFKMLSYLCCCEISCGIRYPSLSKRMLLQAAFMLGIVSNISGLPWAWDAGTRVPFFPDALDPIMGTISVTVWLVVNQFIQVNTMSLVVDFFTDLPKQMSRLDRFWKFMYIAKAVGALGFALIASIPTIPQVLDAPHLSYALKVMSLNASYFSNVILGFRSMVNIIDFGRDQLFSLTTRSENLSLATHVLGKLEQIISDDSLKFSFRTRVAHAQGDDHFWISFFNLFFIGFLVWWTLGYTRIAYFLPALELGGPIKVFAIMSWLLNTGLFSKTWSLGFVNRLLGNFIAWFQGKETIATEPFCWSDIVVLVTTAISLLNGEARVAHYSGLSYGESYLIAFRGAGGINSNAQAVGWGNFREAQWDVYGKNYKEFVRRMMRNVTRSNSLARALYIEHKEGKNNFNLHRGVVNHDDIACPSENLSGGNESIPLLSKEDSSMPSDGISENILMIRPQAFLAQIISWLKKEKPSTKAYNILKPEVLNALMILTLLQNHDVDCEALYQEARSKKVNPNLYVQKLFFLPRRSTDTFERINEGDTEMTCIDDVARDFSH